MVKDVLQGQLRTGWLGWVLGRVGGCHKVGWREEQPREKVCVRGGPKK